ncbi:PREDICTED: glycoprotein-N-acetylgalactosamine 3-beta-galactosyltransferase 1-like [Priapulus caudatus]|uniref:Glycoprotein-N-acetylgalactosamine 3-beta-galactosyltransferase 1-like n=1 Tax=Priapulus caudatus TaxID=37621 RepID=A0ABM1ES96_PRICU|nr:PREDICTED: glycoprotein-N-acetylgalactosamine 3-beta-galactosyltransferase 1-like [Priapulus caudatus]
MPENLLTRTQYVRDTWARRCDKTVYFSSKENAEFPTIGLDTGDGHHAFQAQKAKAAWSYVEKHFINDFDFFYKRQFLSDKHPERPEYYGHIFKHPSRNVTYMSGGPGFILTRKSVKLLNQAITDHPECIPDGRGEDWKVGKCLSTVGGYAVDTRDEQGRDRFMVFDLKRHVTGAYPTWYRKFNGSPVINGKKCCARYPISFHYVRGLDILTYEWFFYSQRVTSFTGNHKNDRAKFSSAMTSSSHTIKD